MFSPRLTDGQAFFWKDKHRFNSRFMFFESFGVKFEIFTDEAVGEAGSDTDLVYGEFFLVKQNDFRKVLDISFDGGF